jgi:hypothetical protein
MLKDIPADKQLRYADLAPFVGSPQPSRGVVLIRVTHENELGQFFARTRYGPPMWIDAKWLREAPPPLEPHAADTPKAQP